MPEMPTKPADSDARPLDQVVELHAQLGEKEVEIHFRIGTGLSDCHCIAHRIAHLCRFRPQGRHPASQNVT